MEFLKNASALLKIKSILTLVVIAVFAVLALNGNIVPDKVTDIVYIVVAFYFGTQHEKKAIPENTKV
jgi:hypothetical protein